MKKLFISAAVAIVALASCSKEEGDVVQGGGFGDATRVEITLKNPDVRAEEGAQQAGVGDENKVTSLEFYIFNDDGTALDTKVGQTLSGETVVPGNGYHKISAPEFSAAVSQSHDGQYKTQIEMSAGESKQILVIANAGLGTPTAIVTGIKAIDNTSTVTEATLKLSDVMNYLAGVTMANTEAGVRSVPTNGFVMTGYELDAPVVANKVDNKVNIDIYRTVSRIEYPTATSATVELTADQLAKAYEGVAGVTIDDEATTTFTFTGYAVINGLKKSTAGFSGRADYDYTSPWNQTAGDYNKKWNLWEETYVIGNAAPTGGAGETYRGGRLKTNAATLMADGIPGAVSEWTNAYSGISTSGDWILGSDDTKKVVYVYESEPGRKKASSEVSAYEGFDADYVVALIIQGSLKNGTNDAVTRYWRINVRPQDGYHITRNAAYHTAITKILTPGYKTPQEAEESVDIIAEPGDTVVEFTIDIVPWTVKLVGDGAI